MLKHKCQSHRQAIRKEIMGHKRLLNWMTCKNHTSKIFKNQEESTVVVRFLWLNIEELLENIKEQQ